MTEQSQEYTQKRTKASLPHSGGNFLHDHFQSGLFARAEATCRKLKTLISQEPVYLANSFVRPLIISSRGLSQTIPAFPTTLSQCASLPAVPGQPCPRASDKALELESPRLAELKTSTPSVFKHSSPSDGRTRPEKGCEASAIPPRS